MGYGVKERERQKDRERHTQGEIDKTWTQLWREERGRDREGDRCREEEKREQADSGRKHVGQKGRDGLELVFRAWLLALTS